MQSQQTRFRVRYAETDQMGVVYYANYLIWMEVGRVEFCRDAGMRYKDMEGTDHILLAVAEANCRYHAPARYDEEVEVETRIEKASRRIVQFGYEIRNAATGAKLASGSTRHVFVDRDFRPVKLPEKYFDLFGIARRGESD